MFHLRWYDHALGLRRLAKTRTMAWSESSMGGAAKYQRLDDAGYTALFMERAAWPRRVYVRFDPARGMIMRTMLKTISATWVAETTLAHRVNLNILGLELWPIPRYFKGTF